MLKRRTWQLAPNATGRVTRGREGGRGGERTSGGRHAGMNTHKLRTRGEDFDSLILPCVALIRREIPPLATKIELFSFCLKVTGIFMHELFICVGLTN